jgi:hypothetical protein
MVAAITTGSDAPTAPPFTDRPAEGADDLPVYLSHALTQWLRARLPRTLRCVVPVSRHGHTVELHAWYALHVFPDLSPTG